MRMVSRRDVYSKLDGERKRGSRGEVTCYIQLGDERHCLQEPNSSKAPLALITIGHCCTTVALGRGQGSNTPTSPIGLVFRFLCQ
jgi:hypothetical protein